MVGRQWLLSTEIRQDVNKAVDGDGRGHRDYKDALPLVGEMFKSSLVVPFRPLPILVLLSFVLFRLCSIPSKTDRTHMQPSIVIAVARRRSLAAPFAAVRQCVAQRFRPLGCQTV